MALEIERRFLVRGDGWLPLVISRDRLQQGYLQASPESVTVRVRRCEPGAGQAGEAGKAWLTLKARPLDAASGGELDGLVRQEFEYPIPDHDALALMALASNRLSKWRHHLHLSGGDWIVDVYEARNAPLVVAEVELDSPDQALVSPPWCALEVTGRHELSNAALARLPLDSWEGELRATLPAWLWAHGDSVT